MSFKFPTVKKFLCCFKLDVGGFIIGWFIAVLFGLLATFLTGVLLMEFLGYEKSYITSLAKDFEVDSTSNFIDYLRV